MGGSVPSCEHGVSSQTAGEAETDDLAPLKQDHESVPFCAVDVVEDLHHVLPGAASTALTGHGDQRVQRGRPWCVAAQVGQLAGGVIGGPLSSGANLVPSVPR